MHKNLQSVRLAATLWLAVDSADAESLRHFLRTGDERLLERGSVVANKTRGELFGVDVMH